MTSSSNFFDVILFLLSSLVIDLGFMPISSLVLELWQFSFIRDWPEIRKSEITHVWVLRNIWRLGGVRDTTFGKNTSDKMLLNAGKLQGTSFYRFRVIKGKPTRWGGGGRDNYSPLRLGSNEDFADACKWFVDNKLSIHFGGHKIKCILFSKGKYLSQLSLIYDRKKQFHIEEYLGCYLDANLSGCKVTVLL